MHEISDEYTTTKELHRTILCTTLWLLVIDKVIKETRQEPNNYAIGYCKMHIIEMLDTSWAHNIVVHGKDKKTVNENIDFYRKTWTETETVSNQEKHWE